MSTLGKLLETYYREHPVLLPWRVDPTPYHVWISEVMLQQTRVETVRSYYLDFLEAFPTLDSFASAEEDRYLKQWEGLGYYSRVRNMHRTALELQKTHGGAFPSTFEELSKLPGIGPYTASAIASIAFHQKEVAVDGNLVRVASRYFATPWNPKSEKDKGLVRLRLKEEMDIDPSVFNQALMDIGRTICLPHGAPLCGECPLKQHCVAHKRNEELLYPQASLSKPKKEENRTIVLIQCQGKTYLEKRPEKGLLASLYQPLNLEGHLNEEEVIAYLSDMGLPALSIEDLGPSKHVFSHVIWHMNGYLVRVKESNKGMLFVGEKERKERYSIPSAFLAYLP